MASRSAQQRNAPHSTWSKQSILDQVRLLTHRPAAAVDTIAAQPSRFVSMCEDIARGGLPDRTLSLTNCDLLRGGQLVQLLVAPVTSILNTPLPQLLALSEDTMKAIVYVMECFVLCIFGWINRVTDAADQAAHREKLAQMVASAGVIPALTTACCSLAPLLQQHTAARQGQQEVEQQRRQPKASVPPRTGDWQFSHVATLTSGCLYLWQQLMAVLPNGSPAAVRAQLPMVQPAAALALAVLRCLPPTAAAAGRSSNIRGLTLSTCRTGRVGMVHMALVAADVLAYAVMRLAPTIDEAAGQGLPVQDVAAVLTSSEVQLLLLANLAASVEQVFSKQQGKSHLPAAGPKQQQEGQQKQQAKKHKQHKQQKQQQAVEPYHRQLFGSLGLPVSDCARSASDNENRLVPALRAVGWTIMVDNETSLASRTLEVRQQRVGESEQLTHTLLMALELLLLQPEQVVVFSSLLMMEAVAVRVYRMPQQAAVLEACLPPMLHKLAPVLQHALRTSSSSLQAGTGTLSDFNSSNIMLNSVGNAAQWASLAQVIFKMAAMADEDLLTATIQQQPAISAFTLEAVLRIHGAAAGGSQPAGLQRRYCRVYPPSVLLGFAKRMLAGGVGVNLAVNGAPSQAAAHAAVEGAVHHSDASSQLAVIPEQFSLVLSALKYAGSVVGQPDTCDGVLGTACGVLGCWLLRMATSTHTGNITTGGVSSSSSRDVTGSSRTVQAVPGTRSSSSSSSSSIAGGDNGLDLLLLLVARSLQLIGQALEQVAGAGEAAGTVLTKDLGEGWGEGAYQGVHAAHDGNRAAGTEPLWYISHAVDLLKQEVANVCSSSSGSSSSKGNASAAAVGRVWPEGVLDGLLQLCDRVRGLLEDVLRPAEQSDQSGARRGRDTAAEQQQLGSELAHALQQLGAAICSQIPHKHCCNNPLCVNMDGLCEGELVGGAGSRCSGCKTARYCSRECQVAHWKQHKTVCKLLAGSALK